MRHQWLVILALFSAPAMAEPHGASPAMSTPSAQRSARKESPFDGLRWVDDAPEVNVDGTWYRPLSIDGVSVADVLASCDERWPRQRQKRFGEDLVEALELMQHTPGRTVALELVRLDDGSIVKLAAVALTKAKRDAIRNSAQGGGGRTRPEMQAPVVTSVPRSAALADVEEFRARLEDQFSYLRWRGVDLDAGLDEIAAQLADEVLVADLAQRLHELLMRFGDGHARVSSPLDRRAAQGLPFVLEVAGDGVVAVRPDRSGLLDPKRPYVRALDGLPLDAWIAAIAPGICAGSPQLVRSRALGDLASFDVARARLGRPLDSLVKVEVAAHPSRGAAKTVTEALLSKPERGAAWPFGESRLLTGKDALRLAGGVGYLRLAQMDDDLIPALRASLRAFEGASGLVVDVRGNGGGQRGLLLALAGYLVPEGAAPVVVNVAAYRQSARFPDDHLGGSRHLYRADDAHWSDAQRGAIAACAARFEPEWKLPDGFSAWHYLVLDRTGHPDEYCFAKPVAVLCDAECFSATDIFLGAMTELPTVTLVGQASGGGSARAEGFTLPNTNIEVRCASMASFRPDGRLYDGRGIEVDVDVARAPGDLVLNGGDAQLQAALRVLAAK